MSLAVAFHRAAREEFVEAATWYESKRTGLGLEFIIEIDRCVAQAAEHPFQHPPAHNDTRRVVARRFPYCVYYRTEEHRIVVLAVFHGRRNPAIWRARLP